MLPAPPSFMPAQEKTEIRWLVVNTQANKESVAIQHIANQKFTAYCPMIRRMIRHARQNRLVLRPLFPGYVFVAHDPLDGQWRSLLSTVGVRSVVRNGERPSLLDGGFVTALRRREEEGAVARPESPYTIGDQVRLLGGPFDGLVAEILGLGEKDRLTVLLDLLSRPVKVEVSHSSIVPLNLA
jgi:transcriptional antiterminator RfaH